VLDALGNVLNGTERIESYDWIRPSIEGGRVVLRVQPVTSGDGSRMWEPVENRKDKPKKMTEALR
jgi:hypothetical protein